MSTDGSFAARLSAASLIAAVLIAAGSSTARLSSASLIAADMSAAGIEGLLDEVEAWLKDFFDWTDL